MEEARLDAVERSGALLKRGDARLIEIAQAAAAHYQTRYSAVTIITHDRQILLARVGLKMEEMRRRDAFCAVAIQRPGEALVVPDAREDARFANLPTVRNDPHIRFYAGIPLVDRSGYALGALCIADPVPLSTPPDLLPLTLLALRAEAIVTGGH